jgi:YcaO-like protein with predicted kinase domain
MTKRKIATLKPLADVTVPNAPLDNSILHEAVKFDEPVVYSANGNRNNDGKKFLKKIKKCLPYYGITELSALDYFPEEKIYVYRASCLSPFSRKRLGYNATSHAQTMSQMQSSSLADSVEEQETASKNVMSTTSYGKGFTDIQSQVSCLMESIEGQEMAPKNVMMVRSSYALLSRRHLVLNPQRLCHRYQPKQVNAHTELMWVNAYHYEAGNDVYVPAEAVFWPYESTDYDTESFFPSSSNGIASGGTYLEAIIHGLYEVIERHYLALIETGHATIHRLEDVDVPEFSMTNYNKNKTPAECVSLWVVINNDFSVNLPMIIGCLGVPNTTSLRGGFGGYASPLNIYGYGCSGTLSVSISRGLSEVFQTKACNRNDSDTKQDSGEYLRSLKTLPSRFRQQKVSSRPPLTVKTMKKQVVDKRFINLREELEFIVRWLHRNGFPDFYVTRLSRGLVDIPVVKVIVPGMLCPFIHRQVY